MLYYHCKFILETGKNDDIIIPAEDHVSLMEQVHLHEGVLVKFTKLSPRKFNIFRSYSKNQNETKKSYFNYL